MQLHGRKLVTLLAPMSVLTFATGCRDELVSPSEKVTSVELTPAQTTVPLGGSMTLTVEARDDAGQSVSARPVFWSSSDTTVAVVSSEGVVSARSPGEAQIAATVQGVSATAIVRVSDAPPSNEVAVTRISITPLASVVKASGPPSSRQVELSAIAYDAQNRVMNNRKFTWSSSDRSVADVNNNGRVTGSNPGTVIITASTGGKSASATVVVVR